MSANAQTSNNAIMKKSITYILFLLLLFSCGNRPQESMFTIEGNTGIPQSTVYLFGIDGRYQRTDSAKCDEEGRFSLSIKADTTMPLALITPDSRFLPLFAEPMLTATLEKDSTASSGWDIKGGTIQELHDSLSRVLDACDNTKNIYEKIDSFIRIYPVSDVNLEIIRRYMTEQPDVDYKELRSRANKLGGTLQDHNYFVTVREKTDSKVNNVEHRSMPSFEYHTADSAKITQATYLKKYTLVTFWATWDKESREKVKLLADIQDSIESKSFAILNISLDYDSAAWKKFITEDSIAGDNVIDSKMFSSPLAKQFKIESLPFTMLVSPYMRVVKYNIDLQSALPLIDSSTKKYDKDTEAKNKRNANKKR